jgi:hypothetical protein
MTTTAAEAEVHRAHQALDGAIAAYNAVWNTARGLDASNVHVIRRAAMAAALAAADQKGEGE